MRDLTQLCSLTRRDGRECMLPVPADAPLRLCMKHLQEAYLFIADQIAAKVHRHSAAAKAAHAAHVAPRSVVYYVRIRDHVKIGTTTDLRTRMGALDVDELLATEPGGRDLERERHKQFAHLHARRKEYFQPGPDLLAHIAQLAGSTFT